MPDEFHILLKNDLAELSRLADEAGAFLEERHVPHAAAYAANLALEEMVSNAIKYGFDDGGDHRVSVRARLDAERLVLLVEDDGRPFDPTAAPAPDTSEPLQERKIGGLGIHLTRRMTGGMFYRRAGGMNRLEIHIPLSTGPGTGADASEPQTEEHHGNAG